MTSLGGGIATLSKTSTATASTSATATSAQDLSPTSAASTSTTVSTITESGTVRYDTKTIFLTPTASSGSQNAHSGSGKAISGGAIAGIVIALLLVALALCVLAFYLRRRRQQRIHHETDFPSEKQEIDHGRASDDDAGRHEMSADQSLLPELHDRPNIFEPGSRVVHEMEAPVSELEGAT